jgi:hypothetical protein
VEAVGGGAVVLKLVDLSQTSEELASALSILRDLIKDSWRASEEMERIREFLLLKRGTELMIRWIRLTCGDLEAQDAPPCRYTMYKDHSTDAGYQHG